MAQPLRKLGLNDTDNLKDMVLANIVRRAGPDRYFLDEQVWAERRQLRPATIVRIFVALLLLGSGAWLLLG